MKKNESDKEKIGKMLNETLAEKLSEYAFLIEELYNDLSKEALKVKNYFKLLREEATKRGLNK